MINIEIDEEDRKRPKKTNCILKDPNIDQKHINLAKLQLGNTQSRGDYVNAIKINKEILNDNPNEFDAAYNLSICYLFTKNFAEAWVFMKKIFL